MRFAPAAIFDVVFPVRSVREVTVKGLVGSSIRSTSH